ncbi:MAG: PhoH family protein [Candidatus Binatia bacterium]
MIEGALDVRVTLTTSGVEIVGEPHDLELAGQVLSELYDLAGRGYEIHVGDVERAVAILSEDDSVSLGEVFLDPLLLGVKGTRVAPKTANQKRYTEAIRGNDMVFSIGPAGTGKTYLAMAMAVSMLLKGRYTRIILARPAVEAGEKLGFLPGDLAEKINPYLRPLYDALYDMVGMEKAGQLIEHGTVEVAPLAFMRGRTLNDAFVILDEAQNTTREQMQMFLTRLGFGSKAVITGDITQVDLPGDQMSGLIDARGILKGIEGIAFVYFDEGDVIRHGLVKKIIGAYDRANDRTGRSDDGGKDVSG